MVVSYKASLINHTKCNALMHQKLLSHRKWKHGPLRSSQNLVDFVERVKEKYWSDWEEEQAKDPPPKEEKKKDEADGKDKKEDDKDEKKEEGENKDKEDGKEEEEKK